MPVLSLNRAREPSPCLYMRSCKSDIYCCSISQTAQLLPHCLPSICIWSHPHRSNNHNNLSHDTSPHRIYIPCSRLLSYHYSVRQSTCSSCTIYNSCQKDILYSPQGTLAPDDTLIVCSWGLWYSLLHSPLLPLLASVTLIICKLCSSQSLPHALLIKVLVCHTS